MGESCVNGKAREKCHFKDGTMRKGRMLCRKEFNLAQNEVWPLSMADNDLGWGLATPERLTVGFKVGVWVTH